MISFVAKFLRWSERYTKTDMVYLAKGSFWLTLEQILFGLLALAVSVAFARFVSPETYGTYRFLLSLYWLLTALTLTGLPQALARAVARGEEGAYKQAFPLALLGGLPMSFAALAVATYYFLAGSPLGYGALAIAFIGPFFQAGYLYAPLFEGRKDFRRSALYGLILNAVPALCLLVAMPFVTEALGFFLIYLVATSATGLLLCLYTYVRFKPNTTKSTDLASVGGHLSVMGFLSALANQLDQLLLFHFVGPAPLAAYAFATTFPDQIKTMFNNITNVAFPKFANRPLNELRPLVGRRIWLMTGAALVVVLLYIVAAPFLFSLLFPAYQSAVGYSQLYALSLLMVGSGVPIVMLQAHAAKRQLYAFSIGSGIFQIIALVIGAAGWGILGVVVARIVGKGFNLLLSSLLLRGVA